MIITKKRKQTLVIGIIIAVLNSSCAMNIYSGKSYSSKCGYYVYYEDYNKLASYNPQKFKDDLTIKDALSLFPESKKDMEYAVEKIHAYDFDKIMIIGNSVILGTSFLVAMGNSVQPQGTSATATISVSGMLLGLFGLMFYMIRVMCDENDARDYLVQSIDNFNKGCSQ
jgi:hypothetical protein